MKYARPPIIEAVMDIRIQPRDDFNVEDLRALAAQVPTAFSKINDQLSITAAITIGSPANRSITPEKSGFQFVAEERRRLFQAQKDGWSFNKLAPYEGWDDFCAEGRGLWTTYRALAQPKDITRVAVRYVNCLDLPQPFDDFKQYILTVPDVAPQLPQALSNFFMQVHIPRPDITSLVVLNVGMVPPTTQDVCSVLLDIDVFRDFSVPQHDEEIWEFFSVLRKAKNDAFEACITDAMRERFI